MTPADAPADSTHNEPQYITQHSTWGSQDPCFLAADLFVYMYIIALYANEFVVDLKKEKKKRNVNPYCN